MSSKTSDQQKLKSTQKQKIDKILKDNNLDLKMIGKEDQVGSTKTEKKDDVTADAVLPKSIVGNQTKKMEKAAY